MSDLGKSTVLSILRKKERKLQNYQGDKRRDLSRFFFGFFLKNESAKERKNLKGRWEEEVFLSCFSICEVTDSIPAHGRI